VGLTTTYISSLALIGADIFAGTFNGGVFRSTSNGTSWTAVNSGLATMDVTSLAVVGTNLFAGALGSGVFLSTDSAASWIAVNSGLTDKRVISFVVSGTNLFAGTFSGLFVTTNNGTSWTSVDSGLTSPHIRSLGASNANLFAGIDGAGVWRRPLSEMTAVIEDKRKEAPFRFVLYQNFPNPFNPVTTISFQLASKSFVSLKVFDESGREMSILLSEELPAGIYSQRWNSAGMASGVYFYRLQADSFIETKKFVLLK
jgi:hypothetical protein